MKVGNSFLIVYKHVRIALFWYWGLGIIYDSKTRYLDIYLGFIGISFWLWKKKKCRD